ncbi:hypothetical protein [Devosia sp. SL43]|uniref:hypothetical protein n=1 Tax=Devosia sp. SL43 TaxID=2806348 RepID=UPI001F3A56D0|nr:hypothetical protein [Devosia sp. SL43]UJW85948.1 hypothetical protein IM737_01260 [Devosia sp. SL43]
MLRQLSATFFLITLTAGPALGACPPAVPGSLPEEVRANGDRLICLQNELAEDTARRRYEFELKMLENKIQDIQLQQRLNAFVPVYKPLPVFQ